MGKKTTQPRPKHPDLRKATPEALVKALLRAKKPAHPPVRKSSRHGGLMR